MLSSLLRVLASPLDGLLGREATSSRLDGWKRHHKLNIRTFSLLGLTVDTAPEPFHDRFT